MSKQPTKYQRKETNLLEINQDRYKAHLSESKQNQRSPYFQKYFWLLATTRHWQR